jgi:hypothetical protein
MTPALNLDRKKGSSDALSRGVVDDYDKEASVFAPRPKPALEHDHVDVCFLALRRSDARQKLDPICLRQRT